MTLTHLPTRASYYTYQPLGFFAAAEGFILVSAVLTGRIYGRLFETEGMKSVVKRLGQRAAKLYTYHLGLLAVAFTVVATIAVKTRQPALQGLIDFYLAHHALAVGSSLLLVYCPPLLDILPMYIVFLLLTPPVLYAARRWGWIYVLAPAVLVWLAAQFGLREAVYTHMVHWTGLHIPPQNLGAFNLYAWQLLWIGGMGMGAGIPQPIARRLSSRPAVIASLVLAVAFFVMRYHLLPYLAIHPVDQGAHSMLFDKWQLGPIRLLNFGALVLLVTTARPHLARWLTAEPLVVLGQSSLEVFSVHLLFCFAALAWVGDGAGAPFRDQLGIIVVTFTGLFALAYYRWQGRKRAKANTAATVFAASEELRRLGDAA
jgi:hypothetical protein